MENKSQGINTDVFHNFFENIEEFLETYEADDPVLPQPQEPDNPREPTEDKDNALEQLLEGLMETPSWEQGTGCSAQSNPAAASQMTPDSDRTETFTWAQALPEVPTEPSGGAQASHGIQRPLSGAQSINGTQVSFTRDQTLNGIQIPFKTDKSFSGNQMPSTDAQILRWNITSFIEDQTQSGGHVSFTSQQNENLSQMPFSEDKFIRWDVCMEDNSQVSSTDIFQNQEEFLQTKDLTVPESQFCAPLTAQGPRSTREAPDGQDILNQALKKLEITGSDTPQIQNSPNEPTQQQASVLDPLPEGPQSCESLIPQGEDSPQEPTEDRDLAMDEQLKELMETSSSEQGRSCSAQSNPTAASHMTHDSDMPKTFSGDQTLTEGQKKAFGSEQIPCGDQMPYIGTQIIYENQMPFSSAQMLWGNQIPFSGVLTPSGSQMSLTGQQTVNETQMSMSMNQSFSGSQVPLSGAQILWIPISGVHTITGNQILLSGNQTHYGVNMTPMAGLPTMTIMSGQSPTDSQSMTPNGTQNFYDIQMVPQVLSLSESGFLSISVPLVQGQSLDSQNKPQRRSYQKNAKGLKCYVCPFQDCGKEYTKSSHLRIHERVHTGDKPYACDVEGCTWKFPRSDGLIRHKKTHTRERPYHCSQCHKEFARSDHVKQHARVHE